MIRNKFYILVFLSVLFNSSLYAQSTVGTDFWVTFLPNDEGVQETLTLIATGNNSCTGVIRNPLTGWNSSFSITPGSITNINIPSSEAYDTVASDAIINKALHITSTDSISLYASNFATYTFDITNILPTSSLGSDYIIQTYSHLPEFSIIAIEDSTVIDINLTGNSVYHTANTPFRIILNTGQCYQVLSTDNHYNNNFSGSTISANNNKKIAVFAGNRCSSVPSTYCCCDHLFEQMMPTLCWGNKFVITNSRLRANDRIRVTALNDNCQLKKDDTLLATLAAKETFEFEITDTIPAVYLETSEPASVFLYLTGCQYGSQYGDPSTVIINPIDQKINNVIFPSFNTSTSEYEHFVNIVTRTNNVANMRLNGNNISLYFSLVPNKPEYSYARISIDHGSHNLSSTYFGEENGFIAHVYGLAMAESYSYSVGSMVINIPSQLIINGLYSLDYPNGFVACNNEDSVFTFDLNLKYAPSNVTWDFGDGMTGEGCPITHTYNESGIYNISCNIYKIQGGMEYLDTTLTTSISIRPTYDTTITALVCHGEIYTDNGFNANETGIYVDTLQTIYGCDSIVRLNLIVAPVYNDTITAYICEGEIYDQNGFHVEQDTIITQELQTIYGCDSIITLDLMVGIIHSDTIYATITEGEYYNANGFCECMEGIYTKYFASQYGCDSSLHLFLQINSEPNLFVENCITPNLPTNNKFDIIHDETLIINDVYIYNRAGCLIFHSPNNTDSWDGKYKGSPCPQASYTYIIYYHKEGSNEQYEKVGTVLVLY